MTDVSDRISSPELLRAEYQSNPLNLTQAPRLSWQVRDERAAERVTAFQVLAASHPDRLSETQADLWNSGVRQDGAGIAVTYDGALPQPLHPIFWQVRTFDSDGLPSPWSAPASFAFTIAASDWQAHWISTPIMGSRATSAPAVSLRANFTAPEQTLNARLLLDVRGMCQIAINERRVPADRGFGLHDYGTSTRAEVLDVSDFVQPGANAIEVLLADGAYVGAIDGVSREHFGQQPAVRLQLHVHDGAGFVDCLKTDHHWKWNRSHILRSDICFGESVDLRQCVSDASSIEFADNGWYPVSVIEGPASNLSMQRSRFGEEGEAIAAKQIRRLPNTAQGLHAWSIDFGQLRLGRLRLRVRGDAGGFITAQLASTMLDGEIQYRDYDGLECTVPGGEFTWAPEFAVQACRWVRVETDLPVDALVSAEFVPVGAHLTKTSHLATDHVLINRWFENLHRSLQALLQEAPLKGVGRHDRIADLVELIPVLETLPVLVDSGAYLRDLLDQLCDSEAVHGGILRRWPPTRMAPGIEGYADGVATAPLPSRKREWFPDAIARLGWALYRNFGDRDALETSYAAAKRLVYTMEAEHPDLLRPVPHASCDADVVEVVGTAVWFETVRIVGRMAGVLGRLTDMELLEELAARVRHAFRSHFVTEAGRLSPDEPSCYLAALTPGLLSGTEREVAANRLEVLLQRRSYHVALHPLVSAQLANRLAEADKTELSYALYLQTSEPSWLGSVRAGGTTLWDYATRSECSLVSADMASWLVSRVAGVQLHPDLDAEANHFQRLLIAPEPPIGEAFQAGVPINEVDFSCLTVQGEVRVGWKISESAFVLRVGVPCGATATVLLPDGASHEVAAGAHEFVVMLGEPDDGIPVLHESLSN